MKNLVASMLVASLLGSMAVGCKDKEEPKAAATAEAPAAPAHAPSAKAAAPAKAPPAAHPPAPAGGPTLGEKIEIPQAQAQFNAPADWKRSTTANGWILFKAPDNHARLGYVTFSQPGEATSRLGQLAEAFDLTGLTWGTPSDSVVGKDHFPDHEGNTMTCTLKNGDPCNMKYMTINPGGSVQMMVVYLVNTVKGEHQRSHATASVASIRRL